MKNVIVLGPLPPPYIGPAIATEILLRSSLKEYYKLIHINTGVHRSINTLGSWSLRSIIKNVMVLLRMLTCLALERPALVLVPISQTTSGFLKDSLHIVAARLFRRRVLVQLRGSNFLSWLRQAPKAVRGYVRFVLKRTAGVLVLGNCLKPLFASYYPDEKIHVAPNGLDLNIARAAGDESIVRLLYLGNMQPEKGIDDVIEAMVLLRNSVVRRATRLDLMGSWRDSATRDHCFDAMRKHDLPVHIHFPSKDAAKLRLLAAADILLFTPSEPEGHPWVIVEAMAAGLPIITTDQGAIRESVIDGENGFIVESRSPLQIAEKIRFLIDNTATRRAMGEKSRRLYEENFTERRMVEKLHEAFESAMGS